MMGLPDPPELPWWRFIKRIKYWWGFRRLTHKQFFSLIQKGHPSSIAGELAVEFPMKGPDYASFHWVQEIVVDDPRIHPRYPDWPHFEPEVVRIIRQLTKVFERQPKRVYIVPVYTVEVIKTYTFEEWDGPLKNARGEEWK